MSMHCCLLLLLLLDLIKIQLSGKLDFIELTLVLKSFDFYYFIDSWPILRFLLKAFLNDLREALLHSDWDRCVFLL